MFEHTLNPPPQRWTRRGQLLVLPQRVTVSISGIDNAEESTLWTMLRDDLRRLLKREIALVDQSAQATMALSCRRAPDRQRLLPPEGYSIDVSAQGIGVNADDETGLFYGAQTLAQLVSLSPEQGVPQGQIVDWPTFAHRWFMPDLGRSVFTMPLLRRLVRLCARLKYNGLHLHLHENELNPVRYKDLPLGTENPFALPLGDFAQLIEYAKQYHVQVIPELESWGHCGSLLQHYPHLYGATRLFGHGHSLGIGPQSLDLLEQIYDQWLSILPDGGMLHVGLDEANWRLLDGADPALYNRQTLVQHIHERVQRRAAAQGKRITMLMWGGGRKHPDTYVPPALRDQIIVMPWTYRSDDDVREQLMRHWVRDTKRYNERGELRSPFIGGAGSSGINDFGGMIEATASWGVRAQEFPNCLGLDVTNWASNDLHGRMLNLYFGAAASWAPSEAQRLLRRDMAVDISYEEGVSKIGGHMRSWQASFPDAHPDAINADRGPDVFMGRYRWGEQHGEPVAPIWAPEKMYRGDQDKG